MVNKILSHDDQALDAFKELLSRYTKGYEMRGMPYWVYLDESGPVGLVAVGMEPLQLFAPVGTRLSVIRILDYEDKETVRDLAEKALKISKKNAVDYASTNIPSRYSDVISYFIDLGFVLLSETYRMASPLDEMHELSSDLRFERLAREDIPEFLELMKRFMSGSPDNVLNMVLENLLNISDDFLDVWYKMESLYIAYQEEEPVGILDVNNKEGIIGNIGVSPSFRGKGYGKQIMLFGMKNLQEGGNKQARLRVHIDNEPAISLYEGLGFNITDQLSTLIWEKESKE
ncbi:MAG: GNAT family N-acetyltransferase [Candidatus Bathyarchaeia archaeon]